MRSFLVFTVMMFTNVSCLRLAALGRPSDDSINLKHDIDNYANDAFTRLWDGEEVTLEDEQIMEKHMGDARFFANPEKASISSPRGLQILGPFNSGTNLVRKLLEANLDEETLHKMCPSMKNGRNSLGEGSCHIWKHMAPQNIEQALQHANKGTEGLLLLVMVRSPLAQISGWWKAPYDFKSCLHGVSQDHQLLSQHCTLYSHSTKNKQSRLSRSTDMGNVMQTYDAYLNGYHQLKVNGTNIMIVEYEKLVMDTQNTIQKIVNALGGSLGKVTQVLEPSKKHGNPVGYDAAVLKIKNSLHLAMLPFENNDEVIKNTCGQLDKSWLTKHSFSPTDGSSSDYWKDCAQHGA